MTPLILYLVLVVTLVKSHGDRLSGCTSPTHMIRRASGRTKAGLFTTDDSVVIESPNPIRGFLLIGEGGLRFTDIPETSEYNEFCRTGERAAVSHVSNIDRVSPLAFRFECPALVEHVRLTAYIVFDYYTPHATLDGMVRCPPGRGASIV